jgi:hypothetical protein
MAQYLIQDTTRWSGNFMMFWGRNHAGYTTDPRKAHHFKTVKEARAQVKHVGDHKRRFVIWDGATLEENLSVGVQNLDPNKARKG